MSSEDLSNSRLLRLLATTRSDDFVDAGKQVGQPTYGVIKAILAKNDPFLLLNALQVAYALGIKSSHRVLGRHADSADFSIKESVQRVRPGRKRKKASEV